MKPHTSLQRVIAENMQRPNFVFLVALPKASTRQKWVLGVQVKMPSQVYNYLMYICMKIGAYFLANVS